MKIIQVIDEVSKRNISLVSVTKIINSYKFLSKESIVITTDNQEKVKKILVLKNLYKNFFFYSKISKILKKYKPDALHIHGMWRPIQFLFILHCSFLNIPVLIQPHGMLLPAALKSRSFLSFIFKLICIYLFYKLFARLTFIAVTKEEKEFINKYFSSSTVFIIKNPFKIPSVVLKKISNKFVYFGRYNRHKNLKEFIQAYMLANTSGKWTLDIYGIDDDPLYKAELINLVNTNNYNSKIRFMKPVFNIKKKFQIISNSSCNVLMSKSEVLSLSVLEAFSKGIPSLVNKDLHFPNWIKNNLIRSSLKISDLVKNINSVINKNYNLKIYSRNKLKKIFAKNYDFENEKIIYRKSLISAINENKANNTLLNNFEVLSANIFNTVLIPFLIILSVVFNKISLASELGIIPGMLLLTTQLFSGNARSILLYNNDKEHLYKIINFRVFLSILFFLLSETILKLFYYNENFYLYSTLFAIINLSWINEVFLSLHEKNKSLLFIRLFTVISVFFYILIYLSYVFQNFNLYLVLVSYLFFQLFFFIYHFNYKLFKIIILDNDANNYIVKFLPTASTFFNVLSVVVWRVSLFSLLGKSLAGIYFAAFSLASFPGTLFNNILAHIVILNKTIQNQFSKIYFLFSIIFSIIIILLITLINIFFTNFSNFNLILTTLVSLLGTVIMLRALYYRHSILFLNRIYQKKVFLADILYSLSISPIILILYFISGENLVIYSYFISSIFAYFFYKRIKL
jgi:glycosyltransferase involved in cell wall biosynthesis